MPNTISKYLAEIGAKGGASGKGKSKIRGDKNYYSEIAKQRWKNAKRKGKDDANSA